MAEFFAPKHGTAWWIYILGSLVFSVLLIFALIAIPPRFRKPMILGITFIGGLFYALEFFLPVHPQPSAADPDAVGNFLTPFIVPFGNISLVIGAWTVGLGVINLCQIHGRRIMKGTSGAVFSLAFFISMILMTVLTILQSIHPNLINKNEYDILFNGGLNNMDATMFSIIAFYIVSAAYRAFRVRSLEATLLLATAVVVMLGNVAIGYMITRGLPQSLHIETISDWILTKVNTPAVRAISFGLGIGGLAIALRIWLGLERGSYFDS